MARRGAARLLDGRKESRHQQCGHACAGAKQSVGGGDDDHFHKYADLPALKLHA